VRENKTFTRGGPIWGHACVGDNGKPSYFDYAKGYSVAANLLIVEVIKKNNEDIRISVDGIVYPICFNMRHSIELRLKGLIEELLALSKHRDRIPNFDLETTHDLGNIWKYITENAPKLDKRYLFFIKKLESYIIDISVVDSTGQVFRYPMSNDNQRHLVDLATISIHMLYRRFRELEFILDKLNDFNHLVQEEYSYKSYTKNLSRVEIYNLAKDLPSRGTWGNEDFFNIKNTLKEKYSISSNELSKAIKIIENNYEFSQEINLNKKLSHITIDELITFFDVWFDLSSLYSTKKNSNESIMGEVYFSDVKSLGKSFDKMKKRYAILDDAWDNSLKNISLETMSEIRSLFYYERESKYSELYILMVGWEIDSLKNKQSSDNELYKQSVIDLLNKTNAFRNIVTSLFFLGQKKMAESLVSKYISDEKNEWVNEARSGQLFIKQELLGYQ
jgi:energy-converting hydrogenase A subunit M